MLQPTTASEKKGKKKGKKLVRELPLSLWEANPDASHRNFSAKLNDCLSNTDQTTEQLEVALEKQVYKLAVKVPKAWPELFASEQAAKTEAAADEDEDVEIREEEGSNAGGIYLSEQDEDDIMEDAAETGVSTGGGETSAARQSLVCMFHLQGRCPWGNHCTADHP